MRWWMLFKLLLHPIRFVQDRIDAWVMARVQRQPGPVAIPRRRVYIVPSRFGYAFAVMLLVMLLGSMNYSNSMAFALTFLLTGLGLIAMHHTHGNLVNLVVRMTRSPPVFEGETAHFTIQIENPSPSVRYSIAVAWPREEHEQDVADIAGRDSARLSLKLPAEQRGWLPARVFSVHTEFPLGLFHAWTWLELDMAALVYPRPAPPGEPPPASRGAVGYRTGPRAGQDEFAGLRAYQRGDTPRSIHWKSLPQLRQPMVKRFTETLDRELWIDFESLNGLGLEQRLSRMCRWVLDAEADHRSYGIRLPGETVPPGNGESHRYRCLKALALFRAPAADEARDAA